MDTDEKLLISRTEDLFRLCDKYASARFSDFLDGAELVSIRDNVVIPFDYNVMFFGGFEVYFTFIASRHDLNCSKCSRQSSQI